MTRLWLHKEKKAAINFCVGFKPYGTHKATICLHSIGKTLSFYQVCTKWTLQSSEGCDLFANLYKINSFMALNQIAPKGIVEPNGKLIKLLKISNSSYLHFKMTLILLNHNRIYIFKQIKTSPQLFSLPYKYWTLNTQCPLSLFRKK